MPEPRPVIITRAEQTCGSHPSQWDAWTIEGQYLYLRYRGWLGTAHAFPSRDPETWGDTLCRPDDAIASFDLDDGDLTWSSGDISLGEFCEKAGFALALGLDQVPAIKAAWVEHFGGAA